MSEFVTAKLEIDETAATIAAERDYVEHAVRAIKAARAEIVKQIRRDRFFLTTLEPFDPPQDCGTVIHRMCDAARKAGVGPMAAVAGAIAQEAMEAMVSSGCTHGWVDNGGDISMALESPVTMEVFHEPGAKMAFALDFEATEGVLGVCASSGTLGHSISFGDADVAVAIAEDAALADALATAICNRVKDRNSLSTCFDPFKGMPGFTGGIAMIEGKVAMHGKLPKLVEVEHSPERLTSHSSMSSSRFTGSSGKGQEVRT